MAKRLQPETAKLSLVGKNALDIARYDNTAALKLLP
jgi:hypothetical protein